MVIKVVIKKSNNRKNKLTAIFYQNGRKFTTLHFGDIKYSDYLIHKDKERRERYIKRHRKNENWNNPYSRGTLSKYILWGDTTSLRKNIQLYKKKFNFI